MTAAASPGETIQAILIVDDEAFMLDLVRRIVDAAGYRW